MMEVRERRGESGEVRERRGEGDRDEGWREWVASRINPRRLEEKH